MRPFLAQHGGDVELLDIDADAGAVLLRLLGSCDGCPSSAVTLQSAVERAIVEAAPEIVHDRRRRAIRAPSTPQPAIPVALIPKPSYDACPDRDGARERAAGGAAAPPRITTRACTPRAGERCELCTEPIGEEHGHLVDLEARNLMCACRGCYLLFTSDGAGGGRYRAVPDRYLAFTDFQLSPAQWDSLQIPVSVAFFFVNSTLDRVAAFYPGPAGATESLLPLDTWEEVVARQPRARHARSPTSRRSSSAPTATAGERSASSCRSTRATSWSATCAGCGGASTAAARRTTHSTPSSRGCGRGPDDHARRFEVLDARPEPHAAVPTIMLRLRITETDGRHGARASRCGARSASSRSAATTTAEEEARLYELFGETPRWGDSLRPFLWTHVATTVTAFTGSTEVDLPIECTLRLRGRGGKYLHALDDGEIPLLLLFTGTVFTKGQSGFAVEPVAWDSEAPFRLPVAVWRDTMDLYFPNSGWLRVSRDTLDALQRFKADRALPTWDQAFEHLLKQAGEDGT